MTTAAERFALHALSRTWEGLSPEAQGRTTTFLHDTLAVGVAGSKAPFSDDLFRIVASWGVAEGPGALVLGRGESRLPPPSAAFVNAFQIHGQEFDCVHEPAVAHPMATIVAVLLAELDRSGPYSGSEVMTALSAGVDVLAGLGLAATTPLRFFRPATAGVFGSIAALARLKGAALNTTLDAFGYGLAFASGTMQAHLEGLPALPVQIAAAARSAVNAFDIAQIGLPGPRGSIDGPFGYLSLFEGGSDLDPILSALEERPRILEVSWKPFPTGRAAHGAIVATQRLMQEQGLKAEDLDRLVYSAPPLIERLVGRPARPGMSPAYARLCFAYLGAVVLSRGTVDLGDFSPERLSDPAILAMAERILVVSDGGHDPAAFTPAVATATLLDGRRLSVEVVSQLGSPQAPLTPAQHLAKAQACMTFAGLGSRHEALSRLMDRFAEAPDAGQALREALTPH